ncbi:MAG: hypothetical protein HQL40_12885 [Alphaproteobacteria bacterium]|nr:hypothetical protein [Alphaproteobacteria bacterium]
MDCSCCLYWVRSSAPHADDTERDWAQCRRHAPVALPNDRRRVWPITDGADWCGEFAMIPTETDF